MKFEQKFAYIGGVEIRIPYKVLLSFLTLLNPFARSKGVRDFTAFLCILRNLKTGSAIQNALRIGISTYCMQHHWHSKMKRF